MADEATETENPTIAEDAPVEEAPVAETATATAVAEEPAPTGLGPENLYEGMFLVDSGKFANDPDGMATKITEIVEHAGGNIVLHRPWSDGKLAYQIGNHRKGLHYVVYFRMPPRGMSEITRACKLSDTIIRQMVIKQPKTIFDATVNALSSNESNDSNEEDEE